jgi:hypothetical protein
LATVPLRGVAPSAVVLATRGGDDQSAGVGTPRVRARPDGAGDRRSSGVSGVTTLSGSIERGAFATLQELHPLRPYCAVHLPEILDNDAAHRPFSLNHLPAPVPMYRRTRVVARFRRSLGWHLPDFHGP